MVLKKIKVQLTKT